MTWNDGYVTDVPYTHGYYPELSPTRINHALIAAGYGEVPPGPVCELGFGHGVSLALHAASHPQRSFHGNDFNPTHVRGAQGLCAAAGVAANLSDESFEQYCTRQDLPRFAFIGLHGIWSWVSEENRRRIVEFIARQLAPGGVLYISYNITAGWAATIPLRELLATHAHRSQLPSLTSAARVGAALEFAQKIVDLEPATVGQTPFLKKRMELLRGQNAVYLSHEFLNESWHATSFAEMSTALQGARLTFAGPAMLIEHVSAVQFTAAQREALAGISDPVLRQITRDFITGQSFRRDLWVKGPLRLSPQEQARRWLSRPLALTQPLPRGDIKISGGRAEATLPERLCVPLLTAVATAGQVSLGELQRQLKDGGLASAQISEAVLMLLSAGYLDFARPADEVTAAQPHTDALNRHLIAEAKGSGEVRYLVSPVTGAGISVPRLVQIYLDVIAQGAADPHAATARVLQILQARGERVLSEGRPVEDPAEAARQLARTADTTAELLPLLRSLRIIP